MMVVDTQVHIWAANTPERPWMEGMEKRAHMPVPLSAEMLLGEMERAGVTQVILVPPSLDGDRNDLCLAAAQAHPDRFAVMGRLLLYKPDAPEKLKAMKTQPGMLGVRLTFHRDNDRPWLTDGTADWFWPAAEKLDIPVMVHAPERLPQVAEIARRHPGLRLIIDHMAFARETMDDEAPAGAERVLQLAPLRNVSVKVSAMPCFSSQPYPFRNLHEPIRRVIEGFGVERCHWGSDFSRLPESCTYRQAVTMFTEELPFLKGRDLEEVMGKSIARRLGWPSPG
jgi:predicted TIM-barrel fold metal-dependent hydrolase